MLQAKARVRAKNFATTALGIGLEYCMQTDIISQNENAPATQQTGPRTMRIYGISGIVFLLLAGLLHQKPYEVVPLFYGHVMRVSEGETYLAPDSPNGLGMNSDWVVIKPNTWTIPNCPKHGLGLELAITNLPKGVEELNMIVDFPPMTLPSGEINRSIERPQQLLRDGDTGYFDFYYFWDEPYERGLGDWRFRLYHGDRLIYDESFTVVACEDEA